MNGEREEEKKRDSKIAEETSGTIDSLTCWKDPKNGILDLQWRSTVENPPNFQLEI